jgi:hypothetical protein
MNHNRGAIKQFAFSELTLAVENFCGWRQFLLSSQERFGAHRVGVEDAE